MAGHRGGPLGANLRPTFISEGENVINVYFDGTWPWFSGPDAPLAMVNIDLDRHFTEGLNILGDGTIVDDHIMLHSHDSRRRCSMGEPGYIGWKTCSQCGVINTLMVMDIDDMEAIKKVHEDSHCFRCGAFLGKIPYPEKNPPRGW